MRTNVRFWVCCLLSAGFGLAVLAQETARPPAPSESARAPREAASAAPLPRPHEDVVKLWKAGLSEDFIRRKIESDGTVYDLSIDDIIALKSSGVPESLIETKMKTKRQAASAPQKPDAPAPT
ncbi:MAG: hypothetical protein IT186_23815, partial [Acidobacteria bacterium]|nr:hypothetical protein [Acidobacteriota bacterium]